jgi:hypothetical protein
VRPVAKLSTLNPGGKDNLACAGFDTTAVSLRAERVANGGANDAALM